MKDGDVGSPWITTRTGGVSPLSLLTFFAAAKKVSAAPHRGNTGKPKTQRGCQRKAQSPKPKPAPPKALTHNETLGRATGELYEGLWENVGTPAQLRALDVALKV